jgi:hypothetical protein
MVVARDAQAAAAWPHPPPAFDGSSAVNDRKLLPWNSAPGKLLKINALRFVHNL